MMNWKMTMKKKNKIKPECMFQISFQQLQDILDFCGYELKYLDFDKKIGTFRMDLKPKGDDNNEEK